MNQKNFTPDEMLTRQIVDRFEIMISLGENYYFDVDEFETIIEYYIDDSNLPLAHKAIKYGKRIHPSSLEIRIKEAEYYLQKEKPDETLSILNSIGNIESSNPKIALMKGFAYILKEMFEEAEKQFDSIVMPYSAVDVDEIFEIAVAFEENDAFENAIKYLEIILTIKPNYYFALFDLAYCYERLEQNDKSIELYKKYLDEDPFSESAWYNLGISYSKIDDTDNAIEAYEFAIAINPDYVSAYFNKANALANANRSLESIETYNRFLEMEPDNIQAITYIAECYESLADNVNAMKYYKKAVEIDTTFVDAWYGIASVLYSEDDLSGSLAFVKKAIDLSDDIADFWYLKACIHAKNQEYADAEFAFLRTIELLPTDEFFWINYADFIRQNKGVKAAISVLYEAQQQITDNALINYRLAALTLLEEDEDNGLKYLEAALKINYKDYPDFYEYYPQAKSDSKIEKLIASYKNK